MALFYYNGWGTTRDVGRAISLMQQAAQTDPKAQQTLNEWNAELSANSYSNQPQVQRNNPTPQNGSTQGGCYIATCVYGSYDCPEVWTLRRYRDYKLTRSIMGRVFIKTYYTISPTVVRIFGNTNVFKAIWKNRLDKLVLRLQNEGYSDKPYDDSHY